MNLAEKLKKNQYKEIWQQYCGFLDLTMDGYMKIQRRLMDEQIRLWSDSGLGQSILKGRHPRTLEEFRQMVPLTDYNDYADILLSRKPDMLPGNPVIWIQTTWEGGKHPIKVAPYTRSMLDTYRNNVVACLILSTSTAKGQFDVSPSDKFLYGLAPLPYATGLFPLALGEDIDIEFLPPVEEAVNMSFSERNKAGFKMAMKQDLGFFFGLGSVAYAVSLSFSAMTSSGKSFSPSSLLKCKPHMICRMLKAKHRCRQEGREMLPKDLFKLKGFMVAGTDNHCYKDDLERLWGIRPMELFAGTEPSIIGTETWTRKGMYFFPDTCFYEFITEADMLRNYEDPSYVPRTYLMDEVIPGEKYELVLTVLKGGAFARYRCGDMYRCVGLENREDSTMIPRFEYVDRVPWIIDIAGFTRISENGIRSVIELSGLPVRNWAAAKEYNDQNRPYLHIYVELEASALTNQAVSAEILKDLLSTYFKYIDQDYRDLKKILGMDPLKITILRCGSFHSFESRNHKKLRHMNPPYYELNDLIRSQDNLLVYR
ncbi:MAG: GH3 auxin-responsive promoter family protein [Lachnospiraceae bacterium]|nr:GH3 auxin-responsive promoter family protein [Lachnospiraceae bacterium]